MPRAARTARGAAGALFATLIAAVSHGAAGGSITPLAVLATGALALPLCVALAGRLGSLWRTALAVGASQFLYHWSFAGLGLSSGNGPGVSGGAHAGHLPVGLASASPFAADLAAAGASDGWMWAAHGLAALLTALLLHRGERAAVGLARLIRDAAPLPRLLLAVSVDPAPAPRAAVGQTPLRSHLCSVSAITHRGPPLS
ncbi:hypothetical protein J4H92_03420 [Leucobacter weissii]|uniref:Uncharacterized protein n=2 Tax=Leucobacter weissii TaxID=1983706 RepID=A0A939MHT6_9MICO|nr:hypothetical protein [Leucobacter weissii]MBO1900998.1 hypothetical protein [Leucobacter weissii]